MPTINLLKSTTVRNFTSSLRMKKSASKDKSLNRLGDDDEGDMILGGKREPFESIPRVISCASISEYGDEFDDDMYSSSAGSSTNSSSYSKTADVSEVFQMLDISCPNDLTEMEYEEEEYDEKEEWNKKTKVHTLKEIEKSVKKLDNVREELKKQLYHQNLILKVRFEKEGSAVTAVEVMKEILKMETHRERINLATYRLELLLEKVQNCEVSTVECDHDNNDVDSTAPLATPSEQIAPCSPPNKYLRQMQSILSAPGPRTRMPSFTDIYGEAKTRIEALSMLKESSASKSSASENTALVQL